MDFIYCPECGERLMKREMGDEGFVPFCESCERPWFSFSYPCVICLVENEEGEIALIRQTYATERFVCVAGFIAQGETAEHAARREIAEEIGLEVQELTYVGSYFYRKNDDLMLGFAAQVKKAPFTLSENEVESARWFSVTDAAKELEKGCTGKELLRDRLEMKK